MKKMIIFDIDGTLVDTPYIDELNFIKSLEKLFQFKNIDMDWAHYKTATDSGIIEDLFIKIHNRKPYEHELEKQKKYYLELLTDLCNGEIPLFREIKGAKTFFEKIKKNEEWVVSIITGGWKESALFKLKVSGFNVDEVPIFSCSDSMMREDIVRLCIEKSKEYYQVSEFNKVILMGDGIWDVKVAQLLGLFFVGIGENEKFKKHNVMVVKDFTEFDNNIDKLNCARIPS